MTAFEKWIKRESNNDPGRAAIMLRATLFSNPGRDNMVWDLLEATGDDSFSQETFLKAAEKICSEGQENEE